MWAVPSDLVAPGLGEWAGGVITLALWLGFGTGLVMRAIEGRRRG